MTAIVTIWVILGITTLALALYRKLISANEEDLIHLAAGEESQIPAQETLARKLASVDRWGKMLTVVTLLVGVAIGMAYMYQAWVDPSSVPNNFFRRG